MIRVTRLKRKKCLQIFLEQGIAFFLFLFSFLVSPPLVRAQNLSLSLSPPLLEVMIKPGKGITKAYQVTNKGESDLYLTTLIVPFVADPQTGQIIFQPDAGFGPRFSLHNAHLQLGQTFRLAPGKSQQLVLNIKIPPSLPEGDYYYTFFVQSSAKGQFLGQSGTAAQAKIGSHLLISVSQTGILNPQGKISQFIAQPKFADLFEQVNFSLAVANTGKVFFKAAGKIEIKDWLGKKQAELLLRPDNILVNSQRKLVCLEKPTDPQTPPKQIECAFRSLFPGRYQAVATIQPNGEKEILQQRVYFYLFPFKLIAALIVGGAILAFLWKRRQNDKHI